MTTALRIAALLVWFAVFFPELALGTWAQLPPTPKDDKALELTTRGSASFLRGSISVQEALAKLDARQRADAVKSGEDAVGAFDNARILFEAAKERLSAVEGLRKALDDGLTPAAFATKATALTSCGIAVQSSPVWGFTERTAKEGGSIKLLSAAAQRAGSLSARSRTFFAKVAENRNTPAEEAALVSDLGGALTFGAYVSVPLNNQVQVCR